MCIRDRGGLAAARGTHERHAHAGTGVQADILQQRVSGHVGKVHVIEDDVAGERAGGRCAARGRRIQLDARGGTARGVRRSPVVRAGGDGRNGRRRLPRTVLRGVEQGEYATSGGERALDLRHHARDQMCIRDR